MAKNASSKLVIKLSVLSVAMFVFAIYVMPPLYDAFCEITGLNGKGADQPTTQTARVVDESRTIRVTFVATNNEQMPWAFRPNDAVMEVHPGQVVNTSFFAKNTTDTAMVSRSVPSFVPSSSANYFHKVECFCFENQPLAPGETADMGLQFYIDPDIPDKITNITASYTIFDITDAVQKNQVSSR